MGKDYFNVIPKSALLSSQILVGAKNLSWRAECDAEY